MPRPPGGGESDGLRADFSTYAEALREKRPRVHAIAGAVVTPFVVEVAGALMARPSVTHAPDEARHLAASADAVLVNLSQPDPLRREGAKQTAEAAHAAHVPWVLDPVLAHATPERRRQAESLLAHRPAVIKPNREEALALAGVDAPEEAARMLAARHGAVALVSGEVDVVSDGARVERVAGGHAFMDTMSGYGCALGMACAALLAVAPPFEAALAAARLFKWVGKRAAAQAAGPGSFRAAFIDALWALTAGEGAA